MNEAELTKYAVEHYSPGDTVVESHYHREFQLKPHLNFTYYEARGDFYVTCEKNPLYINKTICLYNGQTKKWAVNKTKESEILTIDKLVVGGIYFSTHLRVKSNYIIFIFKGQAIEKGVDTFDGIRIIEGTNNYDKGASSINELFLSNLRLATFEEVQWLKLCQKQNCFVPKEALITNPCKEEVKNPNHSDLPSGKLYYMDFVYQKAENPDGNEKSNKVGVIHKPREDKKPLIKAEKVNPLIIKKKIKVNKVIIPVKPKLN